jgi:hypothetical protein
MDEILSAIAALMFWRLVVSTLGAIALATVLSNLIPQFTAEYCITLVIVGTTFGIYWQSRAESGLSLTEKVEEPAIARPVAFVGLALIGLVGGGFFGALFASKAGGAIALILCAGIIALWFHLTKKPPITRRSFAFSVFALLAGYSVFLARSLWKAV